MEETLQAAFAIATGRTLPAALAQALAGLSDPLAIRAAILGNPELYRHAPELRLAHEIGELRKLRQAREIRLVVGAAGTVFAGWTSTNRELMDLVQPAAWRLWLDPGTVKAILAEHVWEHLDAAEGRAAAATCFQFLAPGGRLRLAVPDALNPAPGYQALCGVGGRDGHKVFYSYRSLGALLADVGFRVALLEYWDEAGEIHLAEWRAEDGFIGRSHRHDARARDPALRYSSLIVDGIKPG